MRVASSSFFFFSSRRRHTRLQGDWSSDVCSSDLGARRSGARGAGTHRAARGRRAGRRGATRRVGPGKGIRQHAPRRPAEAVRRSQGATGQDRAARARRDVPDVPATARQRVRGGAGHPRPPDAGDRGRRQVFPATPRAAGPAARGGDRRGGGTRSTVGRKPPGERARRRAARPERGARPRGRATSWPPDPGPGARRVDSRTADPLRPAATPHRPGREHEIAELKIRLRLHHELDRAFGDLRADLNAAMRPEIAELASGFLADLTDGRYEALDLNDDYVVTIFDDGTPKPVISGGEEDVANLVLRLAISQMIAERAGQPLTLLVLDEIFGSLDESRRQHVIGLLRHLADRFPQVVLITHIEQVREGLDRVIRVDYDAAGGTSVVRDDTATLGAADAGVAA